jgi:hypothetical protein
MGLGGPGPSVLNPPVIRDLAMKSCRGIAINIAWDRFLPHPYLVQPFLAVVRGLK